METFEANASFNFESISLANPQPVQGGSFFTRATLDNDKPIYIQLPKCYTKNGIIQTKRGKYSDLLYEKNNQEELIEWALTLEKTTQQKIFDKKNTWFHNELSLDDIETMMSPIFRLYKSGTKLLIRSYIDISQHNNTDKCLAYNEQKLQVSLDTCTEETPIIPLVLIEGIKFSTKSFEIVIKLVQLMILDKLEDHSQICLIKTDTHPVIHETIVPEITDTVSESSEVEESDMKDKSANEEKNEILSSIKVEDKPLENLDTLEQISEVVEKNIPDIEEVEITLDDTDEVLNLKRPNEVYYEIYKNAREKAKHMRKVAIEAFLEAKDIKTKYMLDDMDDSDEDEDNIDIMNH